MNNIFFSYLRNSLSAIIPLIWLISTLGYAQTSNISQPSNSQLLSQQELDAINRQPIASKVSATTGVQGLQKREGSFSYQEENGIKVKEFRDVGQNIEIQVDSSMGTHYQMSPNLEKDLDSTRQTINRVPSISMPF